MMDLGPNEIRLHKRVMAAIHDPERPGRRRRLFDVRGGGHGGMYHSPMTQETRQGYRLEDAKYATEEDDPGRSVVTVIDMQDYIEPPSLEYIVPAAKDKDSARADDVILTASAGMLLDDVRNYLAQYKLKLVGTPESKNITLGGAVLFGAHHGSGLWDPMSEYVVEMLFIDGHGRIKALRNPQLIVNYGLLGVVFRIRIQVFPARNVQWQHRIVYSPSAPAPFRSAAEYLDDVVNNIHAPVPTSLHSFVFGPYSGKVLRTDIAEVPGPAGLAEPPRKTLKRMLWDASFKPLHYRWGADIVSAMISLVPSAGVLASEIFLYEPDEVQGGTRYFDPAPGFPLYTLEYALAWRVLPQVYQQCFDLIQQYQHEHQVYVLRFWCRFQWAVSTVNSLPYGRQTVLVEVTLDHRQPWARELADELAAVFLGHGGRPHLGKTVLSPDALLHYDFKLLRAAIRQCDPHRIFEQGWISTVF